MYPQIENVVHHELNIINFKPLGFAKKFFLGSVCPPSRDYKTMVLNPLPKRLYDYQFGFSWWCFEYFRHWITVRHGKTLEVKGYADDALYWGCQIHSELKQAAECMMDWVKIGEFKNPEHYAQQVNCLLEIMKIPKVTFFAFLDCPEPQSPVAKRLII